MNLTPSRASVDTRAGREGVFGFSLPVIRAAVREQLPVWLLLAAYIAALYLAA